jgi:glutamine amidotransferase
MLTYIPNGVEIDSDALWNGGISNPDGHGYAIASGSLMIMGKSLNLGDAIDKFMAARDEHNGPALFHSRWATHGGINVGNCHPFLVGGSFRTVVAHNGILPREAHPRNNDPRSDTRKFADDILPKRFRRLDKPNVRTALTQWCGRGNKLVILTVDRRYQKNAYLINENVGNWDSGTGIWYSNFDYLPTPRWSYVGTSSKSARESAQVLLAEDRCVICEYGMPDMRGYCFACKACQDCLEDDRDCLCWCRSALASERFADIAITAGGGEQLELDLRQ